MKQLQEYNKLPEPIKIDSRSIKFSSSIYVDIADISGSGWTVYTRTYNQVNMIQIALVLVIWGSVEASDWSVLQLCNYLVLIIF